MSASAEAVDDIFARIDAENAEAELDDGLVMDGMVHGPHTPAQYAPSSHGAGTASYSKMVIARRRLYYYTTSNASILHAPISKCLQNIDFETS